MLYEDTQIFPLFLLPLSPHRLETAIPLLQRELSLLQSSSDVMIAFPDDGAYKRFHHHFSDDSKLIVCVKKREGKKRVVTIKDGEIGRQAGLLAGRLACMLILIGKQAGWMAIQASKHIPSVTERTGTSKYCAIFV